MMLWPTLLSLLSALPFQGALAPMLHRWILDPSTDLLVSATESYQPLLTTAQTVTLGCNTSQTTTQWLGWLFVLAVIYVSHTSPGQDQQQVLRIRVKSKRD